MVLRDMEYDRPRLEEGEIAFFKRPANPRNSERLFRSRQQSGEERAVEGNRCPRLAN
jgi:hypothetical protein